MTATKCRGVALLSVMLLLVLFSVVAIYAAEDLDLSIARSTHLRESEQAFQIAMGGTQWAAKLLEKDIYTDSQPGSTDFDHAGEAWANLGPAVKVEGTESHMRVAISDAQGRFNLNNLIQGRRVPQPDANSEENSPGDTNPGEDPNDQTAESDNGEDIQVENEEDLSSDEGGEEVTWYELYVGLLQVLGLDPQLADAVVDWVDENSEVTGVAGAEDLFYSSAEIPYLPANAPMAAPAELRYVRDYDFQAISVLLPHISALPVDDGELVRINVNTASESLLAALAEDPPSSTEFLVPLIEQRLQQPFDSVEEFVASWESFSPYPLRPGIEPLLDVKSVYFLGETCAVTGKISLYQTVLLRKDRGSGRVSRVSRQRQPACPQQETASTTTPNQET